MPKAIVIVGPGNTATGGDSPMPGLYQEAANCISFAGVDLLGDSLIDRVVQDLKGGGVESVTVLGDNFYTGDFEKGSNGMRSTADRLLRDLRKQVAAYRDEGVDAVLIMRLGPYVEFDVSDVLQSQECGRVLRLFENQNALDIWMLDPSQVLADVDSGSGDLLTQLSGFEAVPYEVHAYVNRLEHPRDFRGLVIDSFNSRCRLRPQGFEVRPGVWMAEGAQVEKEARIVAPAYIGRDVTISQQCLITRGSNIERNSVVDYGTVIEDTSVLPNTYVGIGLDVSHSILDGNKLLNLQRRVLLEIEDSAVMRQNKPLAEAGTRWWSGRDAGEATSAVK